MIKRWFCKIWGHKMTTEEIFTREDDNGNLKVKIVQGLNEFCPRCGEKLLISTEEVISQRIKNKPRASLRIDDEGW